MPTLLSVDIICVQPGVRGLAHLLLAHICCLTSSFTADRTHWLFDISGRESNLRMVRFTQGIGASHMQTFDGLLIAFCWYADLLMGTWSTSDYLWITFGLPFDGYTVHFTQVRRTCRPLPTRLAPKGT